MGVTAPPFPTLRADRSLPRSAPLAVTSMLLLGGGVLVGSSLQAAARVRRMRARGREVPALDHELALPGREPVRRVAVIGDSAAAGHGLPDAELAWSRIVARALHRHDGRATSVHNAAVDGARIGDVLAHQLRIVEGAEVVVVNVGVNDAIHGHRPARVAREMRTLLTRIRESAAPDAAIVLLSAPDLSVAPGLPAILRPPLGLVCRATARVQVRVARACDVEVIRLPWQVLPPEVFGADGFHPGAVGHRRLAAAIIERLLGAAWV